MEDVLARRKVLEVDRRMAVAELAKSFGPHRSHKSVRIAESLGGFRYLANSRNRPPRIAYAPAWFSTQRISVRTMTPVAPASRWGLGLSANAGPAMSM
ncbi:hypothetical protein Mal15_00330 [Stieleria maiorica]|uniref:Uncharacterized protein n=1 Tax=Stieleria maiorica TaxID=2795974 RepID=A0A5B9M9V1_9BACT|nr:hypothetical protein Mal15_00330 [Stieleria maiorica]